jgi:hypothetical protein
MLCGPNLYWALGPKLKTRNPTILGDFGGLQSSHSWAGATITIARTP